MTEEKPEIQAPALEDDIDDSVWDKTGEEGTPDPVESEDAEKPWNDNDKDLDDEDLLKELSSM